MTAYKFLEEFTKEINIDNPPINEKSLAWNFNNIIANSIKNALDPGVFINAEDLAFVKG